jgi:N-acylneuraminate cytidylyltransferase
MKTYALIPARSGSQRIPEKNLALINGHPLIAYSIHTAIATGVFEKVIVSTDSELIGKVAREYGAIVPKLRPKELSQAMSPDIEWVNLAVNEWLGLDDEDMVSILRPTNPLRREGSICDALKLMQENEMYDSLRAIRPIREHPSKMWRGNPNNQIFPFDSSINPVTMTSAHSSPFQTLEELWIQDASLEITRVKSLRLNGSISGEIICGFQLSGNEGFDINYPEDLEMVRKLIDFVPTRRTI